MHKTVWFMKGFNNLYHAISDLKNGDIDGNFKVLCSHNNPGFVGFEAADIHLIEPSYTGEKYIQYCEKIIKQYDVKVIFASNKQKLLDKHRSRFEALGAQLVVAAHHKMIDSIDNKGKLYNIIKKDKNSIINIPDFSVFRNKEQFVKQYHTLSKNSHTLCIKPTRGVYGQGFYKLSSSNKILKKVSTGAGITDGEYYEVIKQKSQPIILMQYLEGLERSVDCVAVNGVLVGGVIRKKIANGAPQLIEDNPELMKQVAWIVKKLRLNGMFNVQFKDSQKKHYLLEINTRLSGRSFYATLAGFNIPYIAAALFSDIKNIDEIKPVLISGKRVANITLGVMLHKESSHKHFNSAKESF